MATALKILSLASVQCCLLRVWISLPASLIWKESFHEAIVLQIVLCSWRPGGVPDWKDLSKDLSKLWINPAWEKGIYVDNASSKGLGLKNGSLSNDLQVSTPHLGLLTALQDSDIPKKPASKPVTRLFVENLIRTRGSCLSRRSSLTNGLRCFVQAKTGKMCVICDPEGTRLFPSYKSLLRHLELEHDKQLCEVCMKVTPHAGTAESFSSHQT